jgi:ribosomal protein S18 acetylase RimI-like enzyme
MSSLAARTRRFSRQDRRPVVAMLSRAFADDPVIRWFLPAMKGGDALSRFFRASLARDVLPHGEVHVAEHDGKIVGAALWRRPGEWHNNGVSQLLDLPWWLWVFGRDLQRAGEGLDAMKKAHPSDPHWYLPTIGVDPAAQGLGVGSALMLAMLRRCESERTPAYLESSKPGNVAFYGRYGFKLMDERHLPDGPPFWPMWRDPAPTGAS